MYDNIMSLAVVVFPSDEVVGKAISLNRQISDATTNDIALDKASARPHITLYQFPLPEDSLSVAQEKIALAAQRKPLDLATGDYMLYLGQNVFWLVDGGSRLRDLQGMVIAGINPLRNGYVLAMHAESLFHTGVDIGDERRQAIADCGDPLTRRQFIPHITLASIPIEGAGQSVIQGLPRIQPITFTVDRVALVHLGQHGVCGDTIAEFELKEDQIWTDDELALIRKREQAGAGKTDTAK